MGGTEMETALSAVFALDGRHPEPQVLLITDGEIYEHERLVQQAAQAHHRVFTVGVGTAVAETFLRTLASSTGGACELVAPQEGMAERVLLQFHRLRQPKINDLMVTWPGHPDWTIAPPQTVFAGDTVHLFAGFAGVAGSVTGELTVSVAQVEDNQTLTIPLLTAEEAEVPRLAAALRLSSLPVEEATALALEHQLLSRWTNFLVVAEREAKAADLPELQKVPQMLAAGWGATGTVDCLVSACFDISSPMGGPRFSRKSDSNVVMYSRRSDSSSTASDLRDKYDIPAFMRRQSDDTDTSSSSPTAATGPLGRLGKIFDATRERIRAIENKGMIKFRYPTGSERLSSVDDKALRAPRDFLSALESSALAQGRRPSPLARIDDLATWGVASEIITDLRALVASGHSESQVVAAFLTAICQSVLREELSRSARLAILASVKREAPAKDVVALLLEGMAGATTEDWNWQALNLTPVAQP
jgi:Ca-activated chloride channel family protein